MFDSQKKNSDSVVFGYCDYYENNTIGVDSMAASVVRIIWVVRTHRNSPPFCNFLHRNAWVLCAEC